MSKNEMIRRIKAAQSGEGPAYQGPGRAYIDDGFDVPIVYILDLLHTHCEDWIPVVYWKNGCVRWTGELYNQHGNIPDDLYCVDSEDMSPDACLECLAYADSLAEIGWHNVSDDDQSEWEYDAEDDCRCGGTT